MYLVLFLPFEIHVQRWFLPIDSDKTIICSCIATSFHRTFLFPSEWVCSSHLQSYFLWEERPTSLSICVPFPASDLLLFCFFLPNHDFLRLGFGPFQHCHGHLINNCNFSKYLHSPFSPCCPCCPSFPCRRPSHPNRGRCARTPTSSREFGAEVDRSGAAEGAACRSPPLAPVWGLSVIDFLALYSTADIIIIVAFPVGR